MLFESIVGIATDFSDQDLLKKFPEHRLPLRLTEEIIFKRPPDFFVQFLGSAERNHKIQNIFHSCIEFIPAPCCQKHILDLGQSLTLIKMIKAFFFLHSFPDLESGLPCQNEFLGKIAQACDAHMLGDVEARDLPDQLNDLLFRQAPATMQQVNIVNEKEIWVCIVHNIKKNIPLIQILPSFRKSI